MKFEARQLRAARLFASNDESRYPLCGIRCEKPDGEHARLIATDGRMLCVIESSADEGATDAFTLRKEIIDRLVPERGEIEIVANGIELIFRGCGFGEITLLRDYATIGQEFPKYRQVFPEERNVEARPYVLSGDYVQQFIRAADILNGRAVFHFTGTNFTPVQVLIHPVPSFYGCVMQICIDGSPDWSLKKKLTAVAVVA